MDSIEVHAPDFDCEIGGGNNGLVDTDKEVPTGPTSLISTDHESSR